MRILLQTLAAGSKNLEGLDELYDGKVNYLGNLRFRR